jgi:hypothetical protein
MTTMAIPPSFCDTLIGVHSWVIGIVLVYVLIILSIQRVSSNGLRKQSDEENPWSAILLTLSRGLFRR